MGNSFYMKQQDLVDHMLAMKAEKQIAAEEIWGMGALSREEKKLYPTLQALTDWRVQQARPQTRRNGNGFPHPTKEMWMLIDVSNSNARSGNYCWWFESRAIARRYKHWQNNVLKGASLEGPYHYKRVRN